MVGEAIAGLGALKTAFDLAKGLKDINDATVRNAAVIELQERILAGQQAQSALIEQVSNLEKEVARLETWETEKQRYKLTDFGGRTFAYDLKPGMARGEPPHQLCAKCYQHGRKGFLQSHGENAFSQQMFECLECGAKIDLGARRDPPALPDYDDDYQPFRR